MKKSVSRRLLNIVLLIILFSGSCSKDELMTATGFVEYDGVFASGGCEWVLIIGFHKYQPVNLPDNFKTDNLPVKITYRSLRSTVDCPNARDFNGTIHLNRIEKI